MTQPPRSNRLGMYSDVRSILDAALSANGGEYALASYGAAIHWRQRAYKFRKLYASLLPPHEESRYDRVIIRRPVEGSGKLILDIRQVEGEFRATGEPAPFVEEEDDLLNEAFNIANKLLGE